ncbi:MAG: hypothetical protein ABJB16_05585 [Saprospiraceae bacterium]
MTSIYLMFSLSIVPKQGCNPHPTTENGFILYADCGKAKKLNCGADNTITFPGPPQAGNAIVWFYFNTSTVLQTSFYFTSNTKDIYQLDIYGPFAASGPSQACTDTIMLQSQLPFNGVYHNAFPPISSFLSPSITFSPGLYMVHGLYKSRIPESADPSFAVIMNCDTSKKISCTNCIGSFAPEPGKYMLSAWVKEDINNPNILTYTNPQIYIDFPTTSVSTSTPSSPSAGPFTAEGTIIDGWQRLEKQFTIPSSATYINLRLQCVTGDCFFDDIRIFPIDGSMKSYVYDPVNLRLVAELDERNYATLYEYDEEGKLIRVKKETEKGIMTIKENKNSAPKVQ